MDEDDIIDTPIEENPEDENTPSEDNPEESKIEIQDSILLLTKKKLGIAPDYSAFDEDVITDINTVLFSLNQMGIGNEGFSIKDETALWSDFLGDSKNYEAVKTYIYLKVRLMFDLPTSSFVIAAMEKQASELEWRLNFRHETENQNTGGAIDGQQHSDNT